MSRQMYLDEESGQLFPVSDEPVREKKTNADRIRAMTDEELAKWLTNYVYSNVAPYANARGATKRRKLIDWLKQEAE